ncbi:FYV1 kinase, partial [Polyodon spathula]|nr:FYV1 kinase [Polyodon spathula]
FSDANAKFYCRIYYAEEFHKMREEIMESRADDFIRSLAHCVNWQARGGKSGAVFYATEDDRFILKQMPRLEVQSFLDFAPHYFTYITGAVQQKVTEVCSSVFEHDVEMCFRDPQLWLRFWASIGSAIKILRTTQKRSWIC